MHTPSRTILITGATDGIGLALARHYQTQGERLLLVGRRSPAALDPALFTPATYCRADLAQPYCAAIVRQFLDQRGIERLDLLIHNAGVGAYGPAADHSFATIRELVAVNLRAPIDLTHTLLPRLEQARGRLVFISSVAAALPVPDYAVYGATKAGLDGFARSLRVELRGRVGVQVIHPGPTRTQMHARSGAPVNPARWRRFPTPEKVAAQVATAIERGRPIVVIGRSNQTVWWVGRHFGRLIDWIVQRTAATDNRLR